MLRAPGEAATVPLALVGHVALDQQLLVAVRNPGPARRRAATCW